MRGFETVLTASIEDADTEVREALGKEGFGVLSEIDIAATLRAKLGLDRAPLKILGACNPTFAHRALELDSNVALVLPCNVVLEATSEGATKVTIADPREMMTEPAFSELAAEAAEKLRAVLRRLSERFSAS